MTPTRTIPILIIEVSVTSEAPEELLEPLEPSDPDPEPEPDPEPDPEPLVPVVPVVPEPGLDDELVLGPVVVVFEEVLAAVASAAARNFAKVFAVGSVGALMAKTIPDPQ